MPGSTLSQPATFAEAETDLDLVVHDRRMIADDVVLLALSRPDAGPLPPWLPGAHVDLVLPGGLVRQYSLCGDPGDNGLWQVAVLRQRQGRGGSDYVHTSLLAGDMVRVRGPRNHFPLISASHYVFIAGGIGITPMVPMLRAATQAGADWTLLYGGRSITSMAFASDLRARYGQRITLWPQDTDGLPDLDALLDAADLCGGDIPVYCCGPEALLQAVEQRCAALSSAMVHVERFAAGELSAPVLDGAFQVQIDSTGEVLTVGADQSILAVLRDAGVQIDASCEEGTCGTCETRVLDGAVDHRDFVLTDEERETASTMMLCVSRAACPRLRLDL
jgi:ferredoxin-NADP reductase